MQARLILRAVDQSARNEGYYYLLELKVLNTTIKIAEVYDKNLALRFARMVSDEEKYELETDLKEDQVWVGPDGEQI